MATAALLGGCENLVASQVPAFEAKDAVRNGTLKAGWWVAQAPGCDVDPALPSARWPSCADAVLAPRRLSDQRLVKADDEPDAERATVGYLLAAGEPMILQLSLLSPDRGGDIHFYKAVRPTVKDGRGRVIEIRHWTVVCGPLEPPFEEAHHYRRRTGAPWPGVENRSDGCEPRDVEGLRDAARRSEALAVEASPPLRWLREHRPDDQTFDQWLMSRL
ncbi:MAG: hypothetical protein QM608_02660 [Caulobacter sp.]